MKVFCSLIVVFTLFLGEAYGKEEQISFRFQLLCLERTLDELKYTASGEVINVEVPKASFSKIYQYTGNPKMDFFVERLEGDQTRRILVQTLNIPVSANGDTLLFLIDVNVENKKPLEFTAFSKDKQLQQPNTLVVINKAEQPLMVKAGDKEFGLPSGEIDMTPIELNSRNQFPLTIHKLFDDEPIKAYSSMLRLNPDNTVFLFVQTDERDDRLLKVYSVSYRDPDASGSKASKSAEPSKKRTVNKQTLSDREKSIYNLEQGADLDP